MSIEGELRNLVLAAFRDAAAELRAELGRPRMLPIKSCGVPYRQVLDAEKRGELVVYRVGNASLVDEGELYAWIRKTGVRREVEKQGPSDEIGELIEMGDRRRRAK
jgi:hypothetical protein